MANQPVALVTGGNRGLGLETCRQLAAKGWTAVAGVREGGEGAVKLDVTDAASVAAAAAEIGRRFGRLDAVVNNAGGGYDGSAVPSTVSLDEVRGTLELNVLGAWRVTQAMLPLLSKSPLPGRVVMVSSAAGSHAGDGYFALGAGPGTPGYAVSKAALNALTSKLAAELKGLLVNAVCPGWTATQPGSAAMGARPVADGAAGIVWAATLPKDGPTGGFFRDGKPLGW